MDFKHEIIGLKDQGDKNHVDENVSVHGKFEKRQDKVLLDSYSIVD